MSDLKNELQLKAVLAAAPSMTRGQSTHVGTCATNLSVFAYGSGNTVIIRNIDNAGDVLVCARHSVPVTAARLSPNGLLVASGDKDGNVIIWANRPDTAEKYKTKLLNGAVRDIAWTSDSERLIVSGEGRGDFASVISVSGSSIGEITGHAQNIVSCDFRKERPYKAFTAGADTKIGFFEGPPFKFAHSLAIPALKNAVTCVRVSPDNNAAAAVSGGSDIVLLDATTGKCVKTIATDHQGTVYAVAWSPDSTKLATASADKSVKVYDAAAGTQVFSTSFGKAISSMQESVFFTSAGVVSVSLSGCINFLDAASGALQKQWWGHQKAIVAVFFDKLANAVVSVGSDGVVLCTPNGAPGAAERLPIEADVISAAAFNSVSGTYVVVAGAELVSFDARGAKVAVLSKDANHAIGVAPLTTGHLALLYKSSVAVFDGTGKKVWEDKLPQFDASSIAAHGDTFAVGGDKAVKLYRAAASGAGDLIGVFQGQHTATVTALAFSPDGSTVASGDSSKSIFVWQTASPSTIVYDNLTFHTLRIAALVFESATRLISASVDCSIIVWELDQKKRRIQDQAHRGGVTAIAVGADSEIISAGSDSCLRRWGY